jgi:hypothetical protein
MMRPNPRGAPSVPAVGADVPEATRGMQDGEPRGTLDALRHLRAHQIWLVYAVLATFVVLGNLDAPSDWKMTQWWFSYELGFVKRGLMGTLLKPLSAQLGHVLAVYLASAAILAGAIVAVVSAATAFTVRQRGRSASWLVSAAFITMPGSIAALAYDVGRYDGLLVVILIGSACAAWRIMERPRLGLAAALAAAQVLGVLIHEIHLFVAGPVILGVLLIRWHIGGAIARSVVITTLAMTVTATVIVGLYGRITAYDAPTLFGLAATELPFRPSELALFALTSSFSENLAFAAGHWSSLVGAAALASTAIALIPLAIILIVLLRPMGGLPRTITLGAALCPLALTVLGIDVGRWATFASLDAIIIVMVLMEADREAGRALRLSGRHTAALAFAVVLGASLGGMAITAGLQAGDRMIGIGMSVLPPF